MSFFKRISKGIHYRVSKYLHRFTKPSIIGGFTRHDGVRLKHSSYSNTTYIGPRKGLDIADYVFIGHYCYLDTNNGISIGEGCQITNFVSILSHTSHMPIRLYGRAFYSHFPKLDGMKVGRVRIGPYSFIGPHTVIMPGTVIGKGSIVSAFSYVSGEFPDYAVIKGSPARVVGDTREMDKPYLEKNPKIKEFYDSWDKRPD